MEIIFIWVKIARKKLPVFRLANGAWMNIIIMIFMILKNRNIIAVIAVLAIFASAEEPWAIYGPDITIEGKGRRSSTLSEDIIPTTLSCGETVKSNSRKSYILLSDNILLELASHTIIKLGSQLDTIYINKGFVTLHSRAPLEALNYTFICDSAQIRFLGLESTVLNIADSTVLFQHGSVLSPSELRADSPERVSASAEDADYLFKLYDKGKIPAADFRFSFPSEKPPPFRYRVRTHGGVATYEGNRFYYGGWIYRVRLYRLEMAYDIWFAASRDGFYKDGWDEWKDLIDHISYIEFNRAGDPIHLRVGLIENLTFGHSMLVDNYSNAIFLLFEKKNGLQATLDTRDFKSVLLVNDIGDPHIFGFNFLWRANKRFSAGFTFAGDLDQLSDVEDSDGDNFPDMTDPEPDIYNSPTDSLLTGLLLQSLDDFESRHILGSALGMQYKFLRHRNLSGDIGGEIAGLSNKSLGVTFPNVGLNIRWISVAAGLDFQTPRFQDGLFDRTYESDKARWLEDEFGRLELVTRAAQLDETEGWLYGWNNTFSVNVPGYFRVNTRFRDIYREEHRDKRFYLSANLDYPIFKYITRTSFFIEQKNVSELLQKKTDGQVWGFSVEVKPHSTITAKIRYRERFEDKNADGDIGKGDIRRNFDGNLSVNGQYWWEKFLEWRKKRATRPPENSR